MSFCGRECIQIGFDDLIEVRRPVGKVGQKGRLGGWISEIDGRNDNGDVLDSSVSGKNEQVFGGFVTHGKATDGRRASVDHDIATKIFTMFLVRAVEVELARVTDPEREMVLAVGIEKFYWVNAFGNLPVAFAQFG